jgi:hypothetical protein
LNAGSVRDVRKSIDAYSREAHPFEWTKQILHPGHLKQSYDDLCN